MRCLTIINIDLDLVIMHCMTWLFRNSHARTVCLGSVSLT